MTSEDRRAQKALDKVEKDFDEDGNFETKPEREKAFDTPGFSRFRTDWGGEDAETVTRARLHAEREINQVFPEILGIQVDLWFIVRTPEVDENGEVIFDEEDNIQWVSSGNGVPIEDYSKLTERQREEFILKITSYLIEWHQRAEELWMEAMLAKGKWEESFSLGFESAKGIEAARTNDGKLRARDDRYFAIYKTAVSRMADKRVRSMELLNQRLKDTNL